VTALATPRLYKLRPWLIRALIPEGVPGSYVLYRQGVPVYVGRSDTDLQRRLLAHTASMRGEYFSFSTCTHALNAFSSECALYHAPPPGGIENKVHPAAPPQSGALCPFCPGTIAASRGNRLQALAHPVGLSIQEPRPPHDVEDTRQQDNRQQGSAS